MEATRYYSVTRDAAMWEHELDREDVAQIWRDSETEQTGHARIVDEIIMEVKDDPHRSTWDDDHVIPYMYRTGDIWTSIPRAYSTMTLDWA